MKIVNQFAILAALTAGADARHRSLDHRGSVERQTLDFATKYWPDGKGPNPLDKDNDGVQESGENNVDEAGEDSGNSPASAQPKSGGLSVGPAIAIGVGGAVLLASAVFLGRRQKCGRRSTETTDGETGKNPPPNSNNSVQTGAISQEDSHA